MGLHPEQSPPNHNTHGAFGNISAPRPRRWGEHRDPFDRLLASQAHIEGLPLATVDPAFGQFGIATMW